MSNIQLEPEFVRLVQGVYGDANLDGRTIKLLYQTWKTNPQFLLTAYRLKNPIKFNTDVANDDLRNYNFADAAKIARQRGLKVFQWNPSQISTDGLYGNLEAIAEQRNIQSQRALDILHSQNNKYGFKYNRNPTTLIHQNVYYEPKLYGNISQPISPVITPKSDAYWNQQATKYGFENMDAVKKWQSENGLVADGKFGKNSLAKWNALQSTINKLPINNEEIKLRSSSYWDNYQPSTFTPTNKTPDKSKSTAKSNPVQATVSRYTMNNTVGGDFGIGRGLRNMASNFLNWINDVAVNTQTNRNRAINVHGRYLQGGKLEDGQKAFVAYLIQVSGAQSEQELNDFIQSLGEEGLKQQYQQFVLTMQNGTQSAKNGAKLNYIKSLRGICPEGYELGYFKEGGLICAKCVEKREKMGGIPFRPILGEKGTKVVQDFKKDLKNKKDKIKMSKKKEKGGLVEKKVGIPIKEKYIDKDKCGKKMKKKK